MNNENQWVYDMDGVVQRIIKVRKDAHLTRIQMSQRLKVTESTYYKYEQGKLYPAGETLICFANFFGLSLHWIYFGQAPMYRKDLADRREMETRIKEAEEENIALREQMAREKEDQRRKEEEDKRRMSETLPVTKPEIRDLVRDMEKIPILFYDIMLQYHRFKEQKGDQ